jgi:hypothetical protein
MSFLRSKRGVVVCAILLLTGMFLVRPGANRLKAQIVSSISLGLGQPVEVGSVRVRLLPQPGFELDNFVLHDDPVFGAEPMLRAQQVTASLRLTSLIRGRWEIARLDLTEPSLNLVRGSEGHWNIEKLVEREERNPIAPTAKSRTERRPGFPYIDASGGRINFKFGAEKKPYTLADADFSLWQESENTWGMRLKARPVRTDFNLTDTGTVQASGTWQRAARLPETPMQFAFDWKGAQLGQLTKLVYGTDEGWRGTIRILVTLAGTAQNLGVTAETSAEDFRRFDVLGGGNLRLVAQCSARYNSSDKALSEIGCRAPVGEGSVVVKGQAMNLLAGTSYDLTFGAQEVPIQSVVAFVRHAKKNVPPDLMATGQLNAEFHGHRAGPASAGAWTGGGQTSKFQLLSTATNAELALDSVPFSVATETPKLSPRAAAGKAATASSPTQVQVGPFRLALGRPTPLTVAGRIGRKGYDFEIHGDAQVQRMLQAAKMIGIPAPQPNAEGSAKMDLQLAADWSGVAPLRTTGKMQLHTIHAHVPGLNEPLDVASANLTLAPERLVVQDLTVSAAGASWHGSLSAARPCTMTGGCTAQFDLHVNDIALSRLNQLFNPHEGKEPWYRILSSSLTSGSSYLSPLIASGKLAADRVQIGRLEARHVTANVELKNDRLKLSELQGDVLGGRHTGEWKADFTAKPPQYSGSGTFKSITLAQLAEVMKDNWIAGMATASYRATISGLTGKELLASATGALQIDASGGVFPHIVLTEGAAPLEMRCLTARATLRDGKFDIQPGTLETSAGIFHLSGSAALTQNLDLKLTRETAPGFSITGTLTEPHVAPMVTPETRAALKQ